MTYTLDTGVGHDNSGLDDILRALLVGMPALFVALLIGAAIHHHSNTSAPGATDIPIVSAIKTESSSGQSSNQANNSAGGGNDSTAAVTASGSGGEGTAALGSTLFGTTSLPSGGATSVVGGMGGGPAGGTSSGGILPINESLYIPPTDVQAGDKTILGTSGTTVTIN